ncbi:MAG TPA: bifunctional hydroxymethylpyrimidine kinase/phosphomethylpyrimidine kinase, partial [Candidatus Nitrosocosmicus sp.]|nr:bifunctional hydroxymethylpyrimidine kinase/phosphomethylpyrimidine kinase [Candidatus Nitrosocosmicus sp.]
MKKVMTIAGSDSSAGAGIQADIKTFSALGVYGTTVITTLTAQNTRTISDILVVPSKFFKNQLTTTLDDIKPDVIKIGVLYSKSIINIVKDILKNFENPIVVDPVLYSGTGIKLLDDDSFEQFKREIIPLSYVITPNLKEAQFLSKIIISNMNDMTKAAYEIFKLGPSNIIIKGGHDAAKDRKIVDFLFRDKNIEPQQIVHKRLKIDETHGTGCNFSAAIASFLAKGYDISESFQLANSYVYEALQNSNQIGSGVLVTNPLYRMYDNSEKFKVLIELQDSVSVLERMPNFFKLIPETKTNFVYSIEKPKNFDDIAGVLGRITNFGFNIRTPNVVQFGTSFHVSNALLAATKFNSLFRSAINIRNNPSIINICENNFRCSSYCRNNETQEIKKVEGSSIKWGISEAFRQEPDADLVYHAGDFGKEPMVIMFGQNPKEI